MTAASGWQDSASYPADFHHVLGVASDERCGEDSYSYEEDKTGHFFRFTASPHPRALPGLPQRRNLKGHSFAAAHISGFVALTLERYPQADLAQVRRLLVRHSPIAQIRRPSC
jgi:hypothetical protein